MLQSDEAQLVAIDKLIGRIDRLHSTPTVALRVMELTRSDDFEIAQIADCLEHDPALAVSILRLVNSSYYGLVVGVTNLPQALAYLGRRQLRLAVLSFGLVRSLVKGAPAKFHQLYWKRSLTMAAAARKVAARAKLSNSDVDTAFAAALMADLGMLLLAQAETEKYIEIADEPDHIMELVRQERETFGFDHMAVSQRMLARWQLPSELVKAVGLHHTYLPISPPLNHVLLTSNLLAEVLWTPESSYMQPLQQVLLRQFKLGIDDLISLAVETKEAMLETLEIFQVTVQGDIDLNAMEQQAREQFDEASNGGDPIAEFGLYAPVFDF